MIEAIEVVMTHWGEQVQKAGSAGALSSPMGTILQYGGCAPRGGVPGARLLLAGAGPDYVASEVEAALGAVERSQGGIALVALAAKRYVNYHGLTLDEQVYDLDLGRGEAGRRAYFRQLHKLHTLVQAELLDRQAKQGGRRREARRDGERMRKAAHSQALAAHSARGAELFKGDC
ncbi:hypothetical protein ACFOJE_01600 [Azotobacter bryophylli]|uniref:Uncharacterized protein n=1 Tax=Azotobacter bryophylli TaxID=1986537 RepID=A0ABV7ANP6_9GAMM